MSRVYNDGTSIREQHDDGSTTVTTGNPKSNNRNDRYEIHETDKYGNTRVEVGGGYCSPTIHNFPPTKTNWRFDGEQWYED
jgi:hypothetical protein